MCAFVCMWMYGCVFEQKAICSMVHEYFPVWDENIRFYTCIKCVPHKVSFVNRIHSVHLYALDKFQKSKCNECDFMNTRSNKKRNNKKTVG